MDEHAKHFLDKLSPYLPAGQVLTQTLAFKKVPVLHDKQLVAAGPEQVSQPASQALHFLSLASPYLPFGQATIHEVASKNLGEAHDKQLLLASPLQVAQVASQVSQIPSF